MLLRFGKEIQHKLQSGDEKPLVFPGNRPYKPLKDNPMKPQGTDTCISCGTCARECPAGAIPKETPKMTDPALCISCMRCIAVCPVGARKMTTRFTVRRSNGSHRCAQDEKKTNCSYKKHKKNGRKALKTFRPFYFYLALTFARV